MAKSTKPVAQAKNELPTADQQQLESLYIEDAGQGLEEADRESFAMPFLVMLQKLSPQCDKEDGSYVEGAEPGMMINTVSGQLFKEVDVIPVHYERRFLRWAPREEGGGFRGQYTVDDPVVVNTPMDDEGKRIVDGGDMLKDTRLHYCLLLTGDGEYTPVLVNLASTQVKKSRQWNSKMEAIKVKLPDGTVKSKPTYSNIYHLTSVAEQNDKGKWYGFNIELGDPTPLPLYQAAKAFKKAIEGGKAKAKFEHVKDDGSDAPDSGSGKGSGNRF